MKTITIRLSDVEAAMILELKKSNRAYRDIVLLLRQRIREDYKALPGSYWLGWNPIAGN